MCECVCSARFRNPESSLRIFGIPILLRDARIVLRYSRIAQGLHRDNLPLGDPLAQYLNNTGNIGIQEVKTRF